MTALVYTAAHEMTHRDAPPPAPSAGEVLIKVFLPASVTSIDTGLRVSAGLGWQSLVGAKLIVASSGIGYLPVKGQANISTSIVMSGMIAIGIVGFAIDAILQQLQAVIERRRAF